MRAVILQVTRSGHLPLTENESRFDATQSEQHQTREESERKWLEGQLSLERAIAGVNRRIDSSIGALGARWGIAADSSFRDIFRLQMVRTRIRIIVLIECYM